MLPREIPWTEEPGGLQSKESHLSDNNNNKKNPKSLLVNFLREASLCFTVSFNCFLGPIPQYVMESSLTRE